MKRRQVIAGVGGITAAGITAVALSGTTAAGQVDADGVVDLNDPEIESNSGQLASLPVEDVFLAAAWEGFENPAQSVEWVVEVTHDGETVEVYDDPVVLEDLEPAYEDEVGTEADDFDLIDLFGPEAFEVESAFPDVTVDEDSDGYDVNEAAKEGEHSDSQPYLEIDDEMDGGVKLTFHNPHDWSWSFDVRVDGEDGDEDEWTGDEITEGPYEDEEFGKRYTTVSVDENDEETRVFRPMESLQVRLQRGPEQNWHLPWITFDVEGEYTLEEDTTEAFDVEFEYTALVTDSDENVIEGDADGESTLDITNLAAAVDAGGEAEISDENYEDKTPEDAEGE